METESGKEGTAMIRKLKKLTLGTVLIYLTLALFSASIVVAFLHLLSISFSPSHIATQGGLHLWPKEFTLKNYQEVFKNKFIWVGYKNTIIITILGTVIKLFFTAIGAYVLSKKYFPHRTFWTFYIVFTMFFSGGLIPSYLLNKQLGLMNNLLVLIIPGLTSAYNLVIMRNFFQSLPEEIEESAMIDGAGRFRSFISIVLPMSKPILATVGLWLAVGHWNSWYDVLIYITDETKFTLQIVLRRILLTGSKEVMEFTQTNQEMISSEGLKAATIYVATLPILCAYPFLQKYFVKGINMGSLKG